MTEVTKEQVLAQFGGQQFSTFKPALAELAVENLGPIANEMRRIIADPAYIDAVLKDGGERAGKLAEETMHSVRNILGLLQN